MSFSMKTEKDNKLPFLEVEIIRKQAKFTTTVYQKPTFISIYSEFEGFLPSVYKFGIFKLYFSLKMFSHLLKLNTIPYVIKFSDRNI